MALFLALAGMGKQKQKTSIDIKSIIDNVITAKVTSEMQEQQNARIDQTVFFRNSLAFSASIDQEADLTVNSTTVQSALANFEFTQKMVNKVQSEVRQKAQALALSPSDQEINQSIYNRLSNRTEIANSVKQTCKSKNLIRQTIKAYDSKFVFFKSRQGAIGDIIRDCNNKNETIARVVQGIENDLDLKSSNEVAGFLPSFWTLVAIIAAILLFFLLFFRNITKIAEESPTLAISVIILFFWSVTFIPIGLRLGGKIGKEKPKREEIIFMAVGGFLGFIMPLMLAFFVAYANKDASDVVARY